MCQLTYIFGKEATPYLEFALRMNALAGNQDGWGIFNREGFFYKEERPFWKLPETFPPLGEEVFGHVRAASSGGISYEATHPIVVGDLLVAHNGHFHRVWAEEKSDTQVFTEYLWNALQKGETIESALEEALTEKFSGAYALFLVYKGRAFLTKNTSTLLYVWRDKDFTIINTYPETILAIASLMGRWPTIEPVEEYKIYEIANGDLHFLREIDDPFTHRWRRYYFAT